MSDQTSQALGFRPSSEPTYWHVDRSEEVERLLQLTDKAVGKPLFVYGRHDIGKTSLIRRHLVRHLEEHGDDRRVRFAELRCGEGEPPRVRMTDSESDFLDCLTTRSIVCVVGLHELFALSVSDQLRFFDALRASLADARCQAAVVFLLEDDQVSDLMALSSRRPDFMDLMYQVPGIDVAQAIERIVGEAQGSTDWLAHDVLLRLTDDAKELLPTRSLGISPRFAAIVAARLLTVHRDAPRERYTVGSYVSGGSLRGLLEGHIESEFARLSALGIADVEVLWRIADEIAFADPEAGLSHVAPLAARLGMSRATCIEILEAIREKARIVQETDTGTYRLSPSQLHTVISLRQRKHRQQMSALQGEVAQQAESSLTHGTALPSMILHRVLRNQQDLRFTQRQTQFLADWVLRATACSLQDVRYWLGRIEDREERLNVLTSSAFDRDAEARLKTTKLLCEYEVPDTVEMLLNLAIQDSDADVRSSASEQLAKIGDPTAREKLLETGRTKGSKYRVNALRALAKFRDPTAVALLVEISKETGDTDLTRAALEALTEIPTDEAITAVTVAALDAADEQRSEIAGETLSDIEGQDQVRKVVSSALAWGSRLPYLGGGADRFKRLLKACGSFVLGLLGIALTFVLPGVLLLLIRRYRAGLAFAALGAVTYLAQAFAADSYLVVWLAAIARLLLTIGSLIWAGVALLGTRKQVNWRFGDLQMIVRAQIVLTLTITAVVWDWLFLIGAAVIPFPHGLFHLLMGRWRRAAMIFSALLLGFGFWAVAQYQGGIIYGDDLSLFGISEARLNELLTQICTAAWYALFGATLVVDVVGAMLGKMLLGRWLYWRARRHALLARLLTRKPYVDYLVGEIRNAPNKSADRAARLLEAHGADIPPRLLLAHADEPGGRLPKVLANTLSRATSLDAIAQLTQAMPAEAGPRSRVIVRALVDRPSRQSLQAMQELPDNVAGRNHWRLYWGRAKHAAALVSTPLGLATTVVAFWSVFLVWEGSRTLADPYRPMEKYVLRNCDPIAWSTQRPSSTQQFSWAQQRASAANSMSGLFPEGAMPVERVTGVARMLQRVYTHECEGARADATLLVRLAALRGLAALADRLDPNTRRRSLAELSIRPSDTIRLGLDNPLAEIRGSAVATLSSLSELDVFDSVLAAADREQVTTLLGRTLSDNGIDNEIRESAVGLLREIGGDPAVEQLYTFVQGSGRTFTSLSRRRNAIAGEMRSGLGISGNLRDAESLAVQSIDAMAAICTERALELLTEIANNANGDFGGARSDTASSALRQSCNGTLISQAAGAAATVEPDEIARLAEALDRGQHSDVIRRAEELLAREAAADSPYYADLLLLVGRAYFEDRRDVAQTLDQWQRASNYLQRYLDALGDRQPDGRAVSALAESRLGIARAHMDDAWQEAMGSERMRSSMREARDLLDSIIDAPFRDLFARASAPADHDRVMSRALAFNGAALIDGWAEYDGAIDMIDAALEVDPNFGWAYYLRALARFNKNELTAALEDSRLSIANDSDYELPYRLILGMNGLAGIDALAELTRIKNEIPESPWPYFYLAVLHHETRAPAGTPSEAEAEFERAFEAMRSYAEHSPSGDDPLMNIQLLELAITSGNLDRSEIDRVRDDVALQTAGLQRSEVVALYFTLLADLHAPRSSSGASTAVPDPLGSARLDELVAAYRRVSIDSDALWETRGIVYYLEHCQSFATCTLDADEASALAGIASMLQSKKTDKSDTQLESYVGELRQLPAGA